MSNYIGKMSLNDTQILVMQSVVMRLNETESLAWINSHQPNKKKPLQRAQFYRIKAKLKDVSDKRKFDLQKAGLWNQHLERIDQLETILKFSWQNYHRTTEPLARQRILDSIMNIQPLLSTYYSASQEVIERDAQKDIQNTRHISTVSK